MATNNLEISVSYNGKTYSSLPLFYANHFSKAKINFNIPNDYANEKTEFEIPVAVCAKYEETDKEHILNMGHIIFSYKGEDDFSFSETFFEAMKFNKETLDGTCSLDIFKKLLHSENDKLKVNLVEQNSLREILCYLEKVVKNNQRVYEYVSNRIFDFIPAGRYSYRSNQTNEFMIMINSLRILTTNLLEVEKIISSNNDFVLTSLLQREDGVLEKGKKLFKVINIPKFALDYIKTNDLIASERYVREICETSDGNDLKILFDFFESFNDYNRLRRLGKHDTSKITTRRNSMLQTVSFLIKRGYKITTVLNYALRQKMYWNDDSSVFEEPSAELKLLMDYVTLNEKNNFEYEKYPQDLLRSHAIALKNFKALESESKNKAFEEAVSTNYHISEPMEIDDFIFMIPNNINDLVAEGNNLHHCIGSYTDNIIENTSHIYFMRFKSSPETSYVTLELNPITNDLVESKENYNKEVSDDEAIKVLKKFEKKMKAMLVTKAKSSKEDEEEINDEKEEENV